MVVVATAVQWCGGGCLGCGGNDGGGFFRVMVVVACMVLVGEEEETRFSIFVFYDAECC